jgi:hypothetical protein
VTAKNHDNLTAASLPQLQRPRAPPLNTTLIDIAASSWKRRSAHRPAEAAQRYVLRKTLLSSRCSARR